MIGLIPSGPRARNRIDRFVPYRDREHPRKLATHRDHDVDTFLELPPCRVGGEDFPGAFELLAQMLGNYKSRH